MEAFSWPAATVVLGILGTICVALIQVVGKRGTITHKTADGHKCVTTEDLDKAQAEIENLLNRQSEYLHTRFHDIINAVSISSTNVQILLDRENRNRNTHN